MLAFGWADVGVVGEIVAGLWKFLNWLPQYPGVFCIAGAVGVAGLTQWAASRTEGALAKFKWASVSGILCAVLALGLFGIGVLDLWGVMPLRERPQVAAPAVRQGALPTSAPARDKSQDWKNCVEGAC